MPDIERSSHPRERTVEPHNAHQLVVTLSEHGIHTKLVCPDDGSCAPATTCSECGREIGDPEAKPCYDCPSEIGECWIKSWADNVDLAQEGYVEASVTIPVQATWNGDHPDVEQVSP
jgi:hypothetical protein